MNTISQTPPLYLNSQQCAARYNISERHFVRLVEQGVMPKPLKLGHTSRWSIALLEEFELKNTARQTDFFNPVSIIQARKRKRKNYT